MTSGGGSTVDTTCVLAAPFQAQTIQKCVLLCIRTHVPELSFQHFFPNSQKLETTQTLANGRLDKLVRSCNALLCNSDSWCVAIHIRWERFLKCEERKSRESAGDLGSRSQGWRRYTVPCVHPVVFNTSMKLSNWFSASWFYSRPTESQSPEDA